MNELHAGDANPAELLCALSFATGVGFGGHMDHGLKSAAFGLQIADKLALGLQEREAIFYGALLKDVACTACSASIAAFLPDEEQVSLSDVILVDPSHMSDLMGWLARYVTLDAQFPTRIAKLLSFLAHCGTIVKETMRSHCEVAELFARALGFAEHVQQTLRFQWERWDGRSMAYGLGGGEIPIGARILHLAQVLELTYYFGDAKKAQAIAQEQRSKRFDPQAVDAFLALSSEPDFWDVFEAQSTHEALLARRPLTQALENFTDNITHICETLADFIDVKTRETWYHSRRVAEVSVSIGTHLGLSSSALRQLRHAALLHDLGKVAIPIGILTKGAQLSSTEWETYRLHSYYTQRILERVTAFRDLAPVAAAHHEWINGEGYHRQLAGEQIPFQGRILAVANAYVRLLQGQKNHEDTATVFKAMEPLVDRQFDRTCYKALCSALKSSHGTRHTSSFSRRTHDLTERECEVLALLAQGYNTPQIGRQLVISRKTVEHHLTHIYQKIGVTCRTAAVVYAVQHHLV